jgi:hypothetical protein
MPDDSELVHTSAPIFIVGAPRSGTTLLARMLDSHSRIAIYHETQYYPLLRADLHRYGDLRRPRNLERFVADVRELALCLHGVKLPAAHDLIKSLGEPTFEGVLDALLRLHARAQGKIRYGEKTPRHHAYLGEILRGLPRSSVIFLIRDPRDTVLSMRQAFRMTLSGAVRVYREAFASYQQFCRCVHTVRYEDLVRDPEATTTAACAYLGERFEPEMLRFFERVPERLVTIPHHSKVARAIDAASVGRFAHIRSQDIRFIEAACQDAMSVFGYRLSQAPQAVTLTPRPRAEFIINRLRYYGWSLRRWRRGWARWKIIVPLRIRYALTFASRTWS